MTTIADLARLCESVYNDHGAPAGWHRVWNRDRHFPTGYFAAYYRSRGDDHVLAIRGSESSGERFFEAFADWAFSNAAIGVAAWFRPVWQPWQMMPARHSLNDFLDEAGTERTHYVTGHSLGGAIATLLTMESRFRKSARLRAVAFDAPGVAAAGETLKLHHESLNSCGHHHGYGIRHIVLDKDTVHDRTGKQVGRVESLSGNRCSRHKHCGHKMRRITAIVERRPEFSEPLPD